MKKTIIIIFAVIASNIIAAQNCSGIKKDNDKFNGSTTYSTPQNPYIKFYKDVKGTDTTYSMYLQVSGSKSGNGVIILLADGSKIEKPEAIITLDAVYNVLVCFTTIILTPDDIKLLSKNMITDYRLYIYDSKVPKGKQDKFLSNFKCLISTW